MRRKRSSIALALAGVFVSGCALLGRGTGDDPFDATGRDGPVMIEVQNDNFSDARIYALWSGTRQRIGTVAGNTRETLDVEWRGPDLRIEVDFIAAGGFVTDRPRSGPGTGSSCGSLRTSSYLGRRLTRCQRERRASTSSHASRRSGSSSGSGAGPTG